MSRHPDVLIIGGGLIGLTTAHYLAGAGARVRVIDRAEFGQEASWAGAGIISPADLDSARTPGERLHALSVGMFPALSEELRSATGIDNGFMCSGGIELVEPGNVADDEWRGPGVVFEKLDPEALSSLEPALEKGLGDAFLLPRMAQVRNPRHLKALLAACRLREVELLPNSPAQDLVKDRDRIDAVVCPTGQHYADRFLVAAGAWSDSLLCSLNWQPSIRPIRGQIALLRTEKKTPDRILLRGPRYLVPRGDGLVLVGSTQEDVGFNKQTTAAAIESLLVLAQKLVPALGEAALEKCWAGLRPASPDGIPYIGKIPNWENIYIAAGHFRSGIQLSPGTALLMKELLLGLPTSLPVEAFSPGRV
jgi:glycine oxidase